MYEALYGFELLPWTWTCALAVLFLFLGTEDF